MKDVFIINPYSGKKEQYALMQQIKETFQGKRIIIEKTKNPGHAQFIAQKYALKTEEEVHLFVCLYLTFSIQDSHVASLLYAQPQA